MLLSRSLRSTAAVRLATLSPSVSSRHSTRRAASTTSLQGITQLTEADRQPFVDVFAPSASHGTLASVDLAQGWRDLAQHPTLGSLVELADEMPWIRDNGQPGLLQQHRFAASVVDHLPNHTQTILDMCLEVLRTEAGPDRDRLLAQLANLKTMFAYFINNFCYEPCRHRFAVTQDPNDVGSAHFFVPANLAQPRSLLSLAFADHRPEYRWQNYNEYSPANCIVRDPSQPLSRENVTTVIRSEGSPDEIGFITNHYVQESLTAPLIESALTIAHLPEELGQARTLDTTTRQRFSETLAGSYHRATEAMQRINAVNREMPKWCTPAGYGELRVWIPGPKGHNGPSKLFPQQGVMMEGSAALGFADYDLSRGETGAMTTILATARRMSLFMYDAARYGENELTSAQADFDRRREPGQQRLLFDLGTQETQQRARAAVDGLDAPVLYHLIHLRNEIVTHNLTHYGYSVNYIFDNRSTGKQSLFEATGGTTHSFLPTSALANIDDTLHEIDVLRARRSELESAQWEDIAAIEERMLRCKRQAEKSRTYFADIAEHRSSTEGERWSATA